uniref:G-protein coupled receptors family 1 profile domain-containing protein n=1 Tax=Gasterosteus aculeatus aculeatus TaxID=481459 RepID=G3PPS9_GASAC
NKRKTLSIHVDFLFSLSGFSATANYKITLSSLTLLCYCLIVGVNVALILTIILDQHLHEPMYVFICNLCINILYGTTGFYPKFIFDLLSDIQVISYEGSLMAYDRYVAICRPLEYHSIMSVQRTTVLVGFTWLVPLCCEVMVLTLTSTLKLCGFKIDKLYCENWSVVKLACSLTIANDIVGLIVIAFYCVHVLFIVCSYVQLIKSALKSREGKRKFTQTCVPHLLCLINVTCALLFDVMYSRYGSASVPQSLRNFMAIQILMIPPILNPIIYGLILTKIRHRMVTLCMMAGQKCRLRLKV